ncbi:hypothetical protein IMCC3317_45460 [Kordia antarctica]|uniref:Uncharacterized protein n=1 Tax=Kordia antarctica TaxID=1218801 RepID=A0A7L4ZR69_9FLAO|nr:hypothetical protein IMCC3317_45460 [Kordia antarctica]
MYYGITWSDSNEIICSNKQIATSFFKTFAMTFHIQDKKTNQRIDKFTKNE